MPRDPLVASMSESGRELLIRIGRRFGSHEVLTQAQRTMHALERFGAQLRLHGFGDTDAALLVAAHRAALARAAARTTARHKLTDSVYIHGLEQAKTSRTRARLVLSNHYRHLRMVGQDEDRASMATILRVLGESSGPGGDDRVYAAELESLIETFADSKLRDAVADSGGSEALAGLHEALATLRRLELQHKRPSDDPDADALDGMIVELARTAHFAAKAAAKELGNREIATEFRLRLMS